MRGALVAIALLLVCSGHAILWVGLINRLHAVNWPRPLMKAVTLGFYAIMLTVPCFYLRHWLKDGGFAEDLTGWGDVGTYWHADLWNLYLLLASAVAVLRGPVWIVDRLRHRPPAVVMKHHVESIDLVGRIGRRPVNGLKATLLAAVPGNQVFRLDVDEEAVEMARLPAALSGLSVLHLSDFHFSGRIERDYFDEIVRIANGLQPDVVAVTGDICDHAPQIDWVAGIFGELSAPLGKYFVLGNHDKRVKDVPRLRRALVAAGCVDLGTEARRIEYRGQSILLAGNELPWFPLAGSLPAALSDGEPVDLRILLSHSPDQFQWARHHDFDLVLAGHTHGGQICLPVVGPIICPSRHGIRYAGGTFFQQPTLMHVSRGVSNLFPLRLRCPPEMTKLVLHRASGEA